MSLSVRLLVIGTIAALPVSADVVINEIMYNTPGGEDVEYVELYNRGTEPVDLQGHYLLDDDDLHDRCMLAGTLAPGDYLVVAGSLSLFASNHPGVTNVNPNAFDSETPGAGFGLGNASDTVRLFDPADVLLDSVTYTDTPPWPAAADGDGPSLELLNPGVDNAVPTNWAASTGGPPFGTPGALNSVFVEDLLPVVGDVRRSVPLPGPGDAVVVSAPVSDDQPGFTVQLFVDFGGGYEPRSMQDDGLRGDATAGDGVFSVTLPAQADGTRVRYYVAVTDSMAQVTTRPEFAPGVYLAYTVGHVPPPVTINEILASNLTGQTDPAGDADDWLELRNAGPHPVQLGGMYLSDDPGDTTRWPLPATVLGPGEHLLIWCDGEPLEGPLHASFSLARSRGEVALYETVDHGNVRVHGFSYGPQGADISFGYFPDGADAPEFLTPPTPGAPNTGSALYSPICINEFLASSQLGVPDWIEFYNRGAATVDLSGWFVSDDAAVPFKYAFPPGTLLAPGGFLSVDETELGFGLGAGGSEVIALTHADGLTGQDFYDFGPQLSDISQGRFADGTATWHSFSGWTRDGANVCPAGAAAPGAVPSLAFAAPDTLMWAGVDGAAGYEVIVGDLPALRAAGGDFSNAIVGCLDNNSPDLLAYAPDTGPDPAFYLVRAVNAACGFGTWDTLLASQPVSRDAGLAAASNVCP